jgi:multiple sugar transport system substrate-binding protein
MDWATYYNKLMVAALDGRGPQVFVIQSSWLARMHRAGFIADVDDLYEGPNAIPPDDFNPLVISQVLYGSHRIGVPLDIWPFGLYSNADFLKQAGFVDAHGNARPPKDRAEFMRAIRAMMVVRPGQTDPDVWGYALTNWRMNFQTILPQFDGHYFDPNGRADLANPNNIEALTFLASLGGPPRLIPPPENGLGWVGFRQKKVAMVIDGIFMLGDLQRLNDFNYVGAPVPVVGKHPGTMAESHVLCIHRGISSAQRSAAERFVHFLSANSADWAAAGQVPARKSIRDLPAFKKLAVQSAFARQIPNMRYLPRTPILFEINQELDIAVEKVIRGNATPKEALTIANTNVQKELDRDTSERKREGAAL